MTEINSSIKNTLLSLRNKYFTIEKNSLMDPKEVSENSDLMPINDYKIFQGLVETFYESYIINLSS